jgi:hypothetical protein
MHTTIWQKGGIESKKRIWGDISSKGHLTEKVIWTDKYVEIDQINSLMT